MRQHNRCISLPFYCALIGNAIHPTSVAADNISPLLRQVSGNRACKSKACLACIARANNGNGLSLQNLQITQREKSGRYLATRKSFFQQDGVFSIKHSNQANTVMLKLLRQKSQPDKLLLCLSQLLHNISSQMAGCAPYLLIRFKKIL